MSVISATRQGPRDRLAARRRRRGLSAGLLIAPLGLFLLLNFFIPIAGMLARSVSDTELPDALPRTAALARSWDGSGNPPDALVRALVSELRTASDQGRLGSVANRLNYDVNGLRTLVIRTARQFQFSADRPVLGQLVQFDARWQERRTWAAIRHAVGPYTSFYLLAALDRRLDGDDRIVTNDPDQAVFVQVFARSITISAVVTAICLLLGYGLAYLMANVSTRARNVMIALVLLPFWTSVLVRTTAWIVILQKEGVINSVLLALGVISNPLELVYNRVGVYIGMTYVLLPFMVLPLYSVMKNIPPSYMKAALSLGARPVTAFCRVYVPQTLPGISAGIVLVFILAIGFYVTPALMGGPNDQMISYFIAFYTNQTLNWGMAAALSVLLLGFTLTLYALYSRLSESRAVTW